MGWFYDGMELPEHEGGILEVPAEPHAGVLPFCSCGWRGIQVEFDSYQQWRDHASAIASGKVYERIAPITTMLRDLRSAAPLERIRAAAIIQGRVDSQLSSAVASARIAGKSWAAIGEQLGLTREAAWSRFRHLDPAATLQSEPGEPEDLPFNLATCADLDVAGRYVDAIYSHIASPASTQHRRRLLQEKRLLLGLAHAAGLLGADTIQLAAWLRDPADETAMEILASHYGQDTSTWPTQLSEVSNGYREGNTEDKIPLFEGAAHALKITGQIPDPDAPTGSVPSNTHD